MHSLGKVIQIRTSPALARSIKAALVLAKTNEWSQGRFQAVRFRSGRLTLLAPSAIAAQELKLRRDEILKEINSLLGSDEVTAISVRT